jgi:hypothetical protein
MVGWKKLVLTAGGFGAGFAVVMASIVGVWVWYQGRSAKPKPWDAKAIVATFDYPDTESGEPEGSVGFRPETVVFYYTLENMTDIDYYMPPLDQLELDGRLKRERSITSTRGLVTLDNDRVFIPAKQRRRLVVHLHYPVKESFGPDPKTKEEQRKRWTLIADYMKNQLPNFDGFIVFDSTNRYQINLPNGWDNIDLK